MANAAPIIGARQRVSQRMSLRTFTTNGTAVSGKKSKVVRIDPGLQKFIDDNYAWQGKGPQTNTYSLGMQANAAARKKMAAEHLARGKQLLDSGKTSDAIGALQTAGQLDPTLVEAGKLLSLARKLADSTGGGVLNSLISRQNVMSGEVVMHYQKAMQKSKDLMAGANSDADFTTATEAAKSAGNVVETAQSLFSGDKYRQMQTAVARQIEWIATAYGKW